MHYFIISNPTTISNEIEIVNHLLSNHYATFHLRKPDYSEEEIRDYLIKVNPEFHPQIVLHSHHKLHLEFNIKGIHFTQHNKHQINNYKEYQGSKSISTHSIQEIKALAPNFNYYFISPVFESVSKPGYGGDSFDLKALEEFIKSEKNKNIVALGGICNSNLSQVKKMGFYGAAILGTFWKQVDTSDYKIATHSFFSSLNKNVF